MPELPEVEVTRLSLAARIQGARVVAVRLGKPLRWPLGREPETLIGQVAGTVLRRGKYLWLPLSGERPQPNSPGLLMHLGMSGSLQFSQNLPAPGPHDHFELETTQGCLRLTDPRRFGAVVWSPALNQGIAAKLLAVLGMEPFDPQFNGQVLHAGLQRHRVAVKQALLGGQIVVGAGNIYACEALFQAGIDPRTRSDRISRPRAARLAKAVQTTLAQALALGGSTLRDFVDAHGMAGAFQTQAQVYGREGQPCRVCATPIKRLVQGQRSTFYCPSCQRR
jgi:formamidopyrimidine-DNA glycosylase